MRATQRATETGVGLSPSRLGQPDRRSREHVAGHALDRLEITSVTSAIGNERGHMLRVRRFESLGFGFRLALNDLAAGLAAWRRFCASPLQLQGGETID